MSQEYAKKKYLVVQDGKATREFDTGKDAVEHMVDNPGYAKLYSPDGNLLMTKGFPPADA